MKKYKCCVLLLYLLLFSINTFAQETTIFMDFRNQKISDIIYAVADVCGESVYVDETVTGTATFHFEDSDFLSALNRFADYCQLYFEEKDGVYIISKVKIQVEKNDLYSVSTENVDVEPFLDMLSRSTNTTILYDALPKAKVTIRVTNSKLEDVLNLIIVKLPGFALERVASGYYITKSSGANSRRNVDVFTISKVKDKYDISIQRASFSNILENLFKKAGLEYTLLSKNSIQLEGLNFTDKSFEELLNLLLDQACCDYSIYDGMNTLSTILSGMKEVDQQEALNQISDVLADYSSLSESTDKKPQVSIVLNIKASGKSEIIPGAIPAYSYCRNTVTEEYSIDFTLNGEKTNIPLPKNTYNMPNTYIYPQKSFFPHF